MVAPRSSALSAAAVPIVSTVANVASYALLLTAAHLMTSADYGKLSSLLGLLLISTIPMLALQTVTARRMAAGDGHRGIVRATSVIAGSCAVGLVALSPPIAVFLHLRSVLGVLLVAATIPATAVLGTAMGVAQGQRDFRRLALLIFVTTGGRSIGGLAGLLAHHTPTWTLIGVLTGLACAALGTVVLGGGLHGHRAALRDRVRRGVVVESLHAGHAHGLFLLLTSLDVLLARHVLSPSQAGVYAVGSVITRAAVWLPQSVVLVMFASLAEQHRHRTTARQASVVVSLLGAVVVGGTAVLGPVVVTVVGGPRYHELDGVAWLFAMLGALLALVQLAVLAGLAQRRVGRAGLLWLTIAADLAVVLATSDHATPTKLVVTLVIVTAATAAAAVSLTLCRPVTVEDPAGGGESSPATRFRATPPRPGG